jgi:hypothetical protein
MLTIIWTGKRQRGGGGGGRSSRHRQQHAAALQAFVLQEAWDSSMLGLAWLPMQALL